MGAVFMAFTETFDLHLVLPSLFLGFLGFAIILMNEIPDYNADKQVDKKNLIVRFGIAKGLVLHKIAIICSFSSLIAACVLQHLPWLCLLALIGPFLVSDKRIFRLGLLEKSTDPQALTGLCKSTIELKFKSWLLLMLGFGLSYLLGL